MIPRTILSTMALFLVVFASTWDNARAFSVAPSAAVAPSATTTMTTTTTTALHVFGGGKKKKEEEDLSFIESRDMTRDEMKAYNKKTEDIMQAELVGMTAFSLVISIPLLYLVWVGFFSETAEMNLDL